MKNRCIITIVGLLLFLPSLWVGFLMDDYYYLGALEGRFPDHDTSRSLFPFFVNDEDATAAGAREGRYPWWIDEQVTGETFRPLSDLLIRLDHHIWGRSAFGYHLHSLVWWAATLVAVGILFSRVLPGAVGALALLLFAIDEAHVMPVAWIANRNALVTLAPMLLALWAWLRWHEEGWRPGRIVAALGVAAGLAAGELGLAVLGYFIAYGWLGKPAAGIRARLARTTPVLGAAVVYAVVYRSLGFHNTGSGVYHDPLQEPVGFLAAAATGIPTLLAGGIAGFSADFWFVDPSLRTALVVVGVAATVGLAGLLRAVWSGLDVAVRRALHWLLAGSALSLVPVAAVFPSDRMLLVPGIGLTAALAAVLVEAARSWRGRRRWSLVGAGAYLAAVHLMLAPLLAVYIQTAVIRSGRAALELAASPVVADAGGKETIVVNPPDAIVGIYLPLVIEHVGGPAPRSWRPLSLAPCDHRLRRTGTRELELATVQGVMLRSIFEELYRDPERPLVPGDSVDRGLLTAEILEADERAPTRIAFRFDRDLADSSLCFLIWRDGALHAADLPAVGEEIDLARTLGPGGF